MSGRPPISADMLANLTPDQRARFEAMMNKMASQPPKPHIAKSCLTKEKLEGDPFSDKKKSCAETVLTSTGSKMEIREVCTGENTKNDVTHDMTVHIEAADSEHVKGTVKSNISGGGNTMNVLGTFTSRWIGADCGDTK
jgi:hypothetical protein